MLRASLFGLFAVASLTGCHTTYMGLPWFGKDDEFTRRPSLFDEIRPPSEADPTDSNADEWAFVAQEARGNQVLERDPDPWWQEYFQSPKARSIERNLGIAGPDE